MERAASRIQDAGRSRHSPRPKRLSNRRAMLIYNLVITIFLGFLGIAGHAHGRLLWPAVTIHAVVALLLARSWFHDRCNHERLNIPCALHHAFGP